MSLTILAGCALVGAGAAAAEQTRNGSSPSPTATGETVKNKNFGLVVHGGAGTIEPAKMTPEREKACRAALEKALRTGFEILKKGGPSLDAVEAAVRVLEDDPLFNAGKGAVFTNAGTIELDAAIMDGKTLKAGAVGAVKHIKNPISLARLVMEKSPYVLLVSDGAESFAKEHGIELVEQKYFFTQERWDELKQQQKPGGAGGNKFIFSDEKTHGTVGAVALDQDGNLAAATSTGGKTNKRPGRIGDTPVIGAGTYASNATCAVSGTGDGEYFMRAAVARNVSSLMEYRGMQLKEAADESLAQAKKLGGDGGLIAIDREGHMALPFNTQGMYRGQIDANGAVVIDIYK